MKKRFGVLALSLLLCSMFVCVATATTVTKTESECLNKTYQWTINGSVSKLTAEGHLADNIGEARCYTTLLNTSNDCIYATVSTEAYNMLLKQTTNVKSASKPDLQPYTVLATEKLTRQADLYYMIYTHTGKAYKYQQPTQLLDSLKYRIFQQ